MKLQTYIKLRNLVSLFIAATVSLAVVNNSLFLVVASVLTGMIFLLIIKSRVKEVLADERAELVGEKSAKMAFNIITLVMGLSSLILIFLSKTSSPYLEGLGFILSYLTLFCLLVYSAAFYYFNRKYGAGDEE